MITTLGLAPIDSRRLTGPNVLCDGAAAVLDLRFDDGLGPAARAELTDRACSAWQNEIEILLAAVGWQKERTHTARLGAGISLAFTAPIDALYAATEVNEWAWAVAERRLRGSAVESAERQEAITRLLQTIAAERHPAVIELRLAAAAHGVRFVGDDEQVSIGTGRTSRTFVLAEVPAPSEIDWSAITDVPIVLVTGTNGKTTTVRLIAAMARAAGRSTGWCTTDGVRVGNGEVEEQVLAGDYSGPGGGRAVLRHSGVDFAVLETARGGLLRRGLAVEHAQVAVITNLAADHLGEFAVADLGELARIKRVVMRVAEHVVLNAEDESLRALAAQAGGIKRPVEIAWFGTGLAEPPKPAASFVSVQNEVLVWRRGTQTLDLLPISEIAIAAGGHARYNVGNAAAAAAAALLAGVSKAAVVSALRNFGLRREDNPGRATAYRIGGVEVLVDYAHNPHGLAALLDYASYKRKKRLLVVVGQAGDRDDQAIRDLAHTLVGANPDRILIKRMVGYLRGRAENEVESILRSEFLALGIAEEQIGTADNEVAAADAALEWAQADDLVLLLSHADRENVFAFLDKRSSADAESGGRRSTSP